MSRNTVDQNVYRNPLPYHRRFLQKLLLSIRPAALAEVIKLALRLDRTVVNSPHGKFWVDPASNLGAELCRTGEYERGLRRKLESSLKPGGSFLDIGANEGYFTIIGARCVGSTGQVIAVEPQERLLPVIRENLRLNGLSERVRVLDVAIADKEDDRDLNLAPGMNTGASGLHEISRVASTRQRVKVKTLCSILDELQLEWFDVAKIDIEGGEYDAILGSPEIFLRRKIGLLALELHPRQLKAQGKDARDIIEMLAAYGYLMFEHEGHTMWSPGG